MSATDPDPVGSITYQLVPPSEDFSIDALTGDITALHSMDHEQSVSARLNVSAYDGINYSYANVTIIVDDVNDNTPRFVQPSYTKSISQNMKIGATVLRVSATDADESYNGYVTYWLTGTDGKFAMKADTGDIVVTDRLNTEAKNIYYMKAYTRDHGIPAKTASVDVTVYLNDSNQYAPVFSEIVHEVTIPENMAVNSTIMTLLASDADEGPAGQITYRILSGNPGFVFNLLQNGELRIVKPLDYEKAHFYQLHVRAQDNAENPQSTVVIVHVTVSDVNDNPPTILPIPQRIRLFGTVPTNKEIIRVFAEDPDSSENGNNNVSFHLPEQSRFSINTQTGQIYTMSALAWGTYQLTIQARDAGTPMLFSFKPLTIEVLNPDTARYYPAFSQPVYTISLDETTVTPYNVINLDASLPGQRPDVNIVYSIAEGNENGQFYMDGSTVSIGLMLAAISFLECCSNNSYVSLFTSSTILT